jgi:hypothetical protein
MPKANEDGWIRHRGGVPKSVPVGVVVEARTRADGVRTFTNDKAYMHKQVVTWRHFGERDALGSSDIMAYRLKEQPKQ